LHYAVGISRQLYGLTIATERHEHRMSETWHPLGVTGIISAFNFPVAVWSWNAALALVCGNSTVWKPSEKTTLTALATQALFGRALRRFKTDGGSAPDGLSTVLVGGREIGEALVNNARVPLVSATGSTAMGRAVAPKLARRFARAILELGGNNAAVVTPTADLDLTLRGVAFAAMGTAGQRCTTLRRLFVHESVYDSFVPRLKKVYASVSVGNPLTGNLVGPLIDGLAYEAMQRALGEAEAAGAAITGGDRVTLAGADAAFYVRPALVEIAGQAAPVERETFAPILYVIKYSDFDAVLELHNAVPQGLSSSIFTNDLREAETVGARLRLRDCQRKHRTFGRRNRRRIRRREGDRWRARIRIGCMEGLYAPCHQHDQFRPHAATRPGRQIRCGLIGNRCERPVPVGNSILLATDIEPGDAPALCEGFVA